MSSTLQARIDQIKKDLGIESEQDISGMKISDSHEVLISISGKNGWFKVGQGNDNNDAQSLFLGLMTGEAPESLQQTHRDGSHNHILDASVNTAEDIPEAYRPSEQSEGILIGGPGSDDEA